MHAVVLVAALLSFVAPVSAQGDECSAVESWVNGCDTGDTDVVIDGTQETDGDPGTDGTDGEWNPPTGDGTPEGPTEFEQCIDLWDSMIYCYRPDEETDDDDGTPEVPPITITDLARFAPEGSVISGEPDNVGVAGLPTNFVAAASEQTVAGELFGFPLSVRFTPSAFDFTYGDGSATTTTSGGSAWADLGQAQFTPTATSHTYGERGTYIAQVNVRYTAEVDFGIGWIPIAGEVTSTGPPQEIRVFEAYTALVAHTCAEAPSSPGC